MDFYFLSEKWFKKAQSSGVDRQGSACAKRVYPMFFHRKLWKYNSRQVFWLILFGSPSHLLAEKVAFWTKIYRIYSSGNCLGFSPNSLFIPCGNQEQPQRYKIIVCITNCTKLRNSIFMQRRIFANISTNFKIKNLKS